MLEELGKAAAAAATGQGGLREQTNRGEVPDSSYEEGRRPRQPSQTQLSGGTTSGGWSDWHRVVSVY